MNLNGMTRCFLKPRATDQLRAYPYCILNELISQKTDVKYYRTVPNLYGRSLRERRRGKYKSEEMVLPHMLC